MANQSGNVSHQAYEDWWISIAKRVVTLATLRTEASARILPRMPFDKEVL